MFFQASDEKIILQEVGLIAERWKWTEESILSLPTRKRREYVKQIIDLYEKEKEAYNKAKK